MSTGRLGGEGGWALASAGGKDATLALFRAREEGVRVRWGVNVFEGTSGLVRFHGTPPGLLSRQFDALGLEARFASTHPADFEEAFLELLDGLVEEGARGIVFGNLHLVEIREWYEERVRSRGLEHLEPLWGGGPEEVAREVVRKGFDATVVSVQLGAGDPAWLGRSLDDTLLDAFLAAGIDPCGERGEYHTFVAAGPGFSYPVSLRWEGERELEGHRFLKLV